MTVSTNARRTGYDIHHRDADEIYDRDVDILEDLYIRDIELQRIRQNYRRNFFTKDRFCSECGWGCGSGLMGLTHMHLNGKKYSCK